MKYYTQTDLWDELHVPTPRCLGDTKPALMLEIGLSKITTLISPIHSYCSGVVVTTSLG